MKSINDQNKSFRTIWWTVGSYYLQITWAIKWRGERLWATWQTAILLMLSLLFTLEWVPWGFPAPWGKWQHGTMSQPERYACQDLHVGLESRGKKRSEARARHWTHVLCVCAVCICGLHTTSVSKLPKENHASSSFQEEVIKTLWPFIKSTRMLLFLPSSLRLLTEPPSSQEWTGNVWNILSHLFSTQTVTMREKRGAAVGLREFSGCTMDSMHTMHGCLSTVKTSSQMLLFPSAQPVNADIGMGNLVTESFWSEKERARKQITWKKLLLKY